MDECTNRCNLGYHRLIKFGFLAITLHLTIIQPTLNNSSTNHYSTSRKSKKRHRLFVLVLQLKVKQRVDAQERACARGKIAEGWQRVKHLGRGSLRRVLRPFCFTIIPPAFGQCIFRGITRRVRRDSHVFVHFSPSNPHDCVLQSLYSEYSTDKST